MAILKKETTLLRVAAALKLEGTSLPTRLTHQEKPEHHRPRKAKAAETKASGHRHLHHASKRSVSEGLSVQHTKLSTSDYQWLGMSFHQVPTSSCCAIMMCFQFMVVYTALAMCRTYHELTNTPKGQLEAALRAAAQTLTYGPMLCALFVAVRMRAEELSNGKAEPQAWVQKCMPALSLVVLLSTLLVLVIQSVAGRPIRLKENPFDIEMPFEEIEKGYKGAFYFLTAVRYLLLFALYGGLAAVIAGICTYLPPAFQSLGDIDAPVPAVMCTMVLAAVFFSSQFIVAVCRTYLEHTRMNFPQIVGMMHATATTLEFAPVLSTLFLAAQLRATQHNAELDDWVHNCMLISTGSLCVTGLLTFLVPLLLCGTLTKNPWTNEVVVELPKPTVGYIFIGLKYVSMLICYLGAIGVMIGIFVFESPGPMLTMPVSPSAQCVVNLTCQFIFVYSVVIALHTATEMTGGTVPIENWSLFSAIEAARSTLAFAPILSIVFIATGGTDGPSPWIQEAMYLATWSLQMTGVMCLATGLFMEKTKIDYDGNVVNRFANRRVGVIVVSVRYISMFLLYSGAIMVIIGAITMAAESADGPAPVQRAVHQNGTAFASQPSA